ncbi:MAG: hypothetical protein A2Y73_04645 [Chloroflexi bacterium RBG_13_56_8]|nr:MAG: hypothetical protein A2Y73_04645 [Chloroflexi bacterium RBG_13_56_8]
MLPRDAKVTVQDVWRLALPTGTQLVGGRAGLDIPVEWVASLSGTFPLFGVLEKGYLALARLEAARHLDVRFTPRYLLTELRRAEASALVVDEAISEEDAALADEFALPVFCLPEGTDLHLLERQIIRTLVDREGQVARREREARDHLTQLLGRRGLQAVIDELSRLTSAEVALKEGDQFVLASANAPVEEKTGSEQVFPIEVAGKLLGELVLYAGSQGFDELDAIYLRQGAEVCGIELLQRFARREAEERLGADLVELLLDETQKGDAIASRFMRLEYDLSPERRHLVIALISAEEGVGDVACHYVARDLEWAAQRESAGFLSASYGEYLLLFLSIVSQASEWRLRHWVQEGLSSASGKRCLVGISRLVTGMEGLRDAVCQAMDALALGQHISGRKGPYHYEELGLYRLLAGLRNREELKAFCEETLGELIRYDELRGTDLLYTLEVFFDQNTNASQAAKALYVHRNTLNYRLQRIVEITGLDLNNAEARLALQLAIKAYRLSV